VRGAANLSVIDQPSVCDAYNGGDGSNDARLNDNSGASKKRYAGAKPIKFVGSLKKHQQTKNLLQTPFPKGAGSRNESLLLLFFRKEDLTF
jgi:hypothetical protein